MLTKKSSNNITGIYKVLTLNELNDSNSNASELNKTSISIASNERNEELEKGITSIITTKKIVKNESIKDLEEINFENVTNTQEILDFYDYTKECFAKVMSIKWPIENIDKKYYIDYKLDKSKCKNIHIFNLLKNR